MEKYIYNLFWMTFLGASIFGIVYFVNMHGNQSNYYQLSGEEAKIRENISNSLAENQNLVPTTDQSGLTVPTDDVATNVVGTDSTNSGTTTSIINPAVTQTPKITFDEKVKKELKDKIQGLLNDKITMKATSKGTRVGTIEKFLNAYLNEKNVIANLYSPALIDRVKRFETAQGLSKTDGLASSLDYEEMLKLLNQ